MNMYEYKLKKNQNKILVIITVLIILIVMRNTIGSGKTFISTFHQTYNERKFLAIYVNIFLLSLFPILKNIYPVNIAVRSVTKWRGLTVAWKRIVQMATMYAFFLTIGWYFVIGSLVDGWWKKEYRIYIFAIFVTQVIGWLEIGMLELTIFIFIKNIPLGFVVSNVVLVLMNLSLYISSSEVYVQYVRIYDFMYELYQFNGVFTMLSVAFFHIVIIMALGLIGYYILKIHDFIPGGKRFYVEKR